MPPNYCNDSAPTVLDGAARFAIRSTAYMMLDQLTVADMDRFRHTFVRILLEKRLPVADVAELIGDTEDVVRRHNARWVPERQARTTNILNEAFSDKPRPKLIAMPRSS